MKIKETIMKILERILWGFIGFAVGVVLGILLGEMISIAVWAWTGKLTVYSMLEIIKTSTQICGIIGGIIGIVKKE